MASMWLAVGLMWLFCTESANCEKTTEQKLVDDILDTYDKRVKPKRHPDTPVRIVFRLDLYQILEVNEPKQYVSLNAWLSETWEDDLLFWRPERYENISELTLPHHVVWLPDTMLYNSLTMQDSDTRRLLNVKLTTNTSKKTVTVDLLYPTIFTFSCHLNIRYFPFDRQQCSLTIGSWTYDTSGIDYAPLSKTVGLGSYLENEGWSLLTFTAERRLHNYSCCPHPWVLLHYKMKLERKPLFYIVNLVVPTMIITLISIVGFFMPSSASGERHEKITLGITTLLSMSILLMMISDKMPTTSDFVPLIGWFYLTMIGLISAGTIMSAMVICVQRQGELGKRLSSRARNFTKLLSRITCVRLPAHLMLQQQSAKPEKRLSARQTTNEKIENDQKKSLVQKRSVQKKNSDCVFFQEKTLFMDTNGKMQLMQNEAKRELSADREMQHLALKEYEWLASVLERLFLLVFVFLLFSSTGGILGLGMLQRMWSS